MNLIDAFYLLLAYLIGSIPFGYLIGRVHGVDLREVGSGNIGATNVLRTLGKWWGYSVFFLDFGKGVLAVGLAILAGSPEWILVGSGVLVIAGHNFPVWLGFRGGKGIATSAGVLITLFPWPVFISALIAWVLLFFTTRYVSVASLASAIALAGSAIVLSFYNQMSWFLAGTALVISLLGVLRHRSNIDRLCRGTEPKFSKGKTIKEGTP